MKQRIKAYIFKLEFSSSKVARPNIYGQNSKTDVSEPRKYPLKPCHPCQLILSCLTLFIHRIMTFSSTGICLGLQIKNEFYC